MGKLADRIKLVRKQAKLSQERFADALGTVDGVKVSRGAVGNWELGKGISRSNLAAIAEKFSVPLDWLEFGRGEHPQKIIPAMDGGPLTAGKMPHNVGAQFDLNAKLGKPVRGFARIPIRGQGMGGGEGVLIFSDQNLGDVLAPPSLADVPDAYAVYVIGDSMLERYQHGEVVYVHPYLPVRKGDDCVVQLKESDEGQIVGMIKRFVSLDDKTLKVRQLNPEKILTFPRSRVVAIHRIMMGGPA
jgi:phage repressor protein C with HTH and peptisase S24 domain